jgi:hypothetical protein
MSEVAQDEAFKQSFQPREFLRRELSEIFLLIQHITSQSGKQLANVFTPDAAKLGMTLDEVWLTYEAVAYDTRIADDGVSDENDLPAAHRFRNSYGLSAARLLEVKDRLAIEARPATALTIAFTTLSASQRLSFFSVAATVMQALFSTLTEIRNLLAGWLRWALRLPPRYAAERPAPVDPGVLFAGIAFPALRPKKNELWLTVFLSVIVLFSLIVWSASASWTLTAGVRSIDDYANLLKLQQINEEAIAAEGRDLEKAISDSLLPLVQDNEEVARAARQITESSHSLDALAANAASEHAARLHDQEAAAAAKLVQTKPAKRSHGVAVRQVVSLTPMPAPAPSPPASDTALEMINKITVEIQADALLLQKAAGQIATASSPHRTVDACRHSDLLGYAGPAELAIKVYDSLKQESLCDERTTLKGKIESARLVIAQWVWSQSGGLPYLVGIDIKDPHNDQASIQLALAQANMLVQLLNFNILPASLAGLASLVAGLRWLNAKIENNELSPRNLQMFWPRIFLGISLGVAIGMLSSPIGDGKSVTLPGLTSEGVVLSAPLLAFLAGFATNRIFSWLDDLVSHIFSFGRKMDERDGVAPARATEG